MGTLVKGNNYNNAAPKVQQWQRQVAWRWRRMSHRTGSSYAAGLNRPLQGVPISKVLLVGGATRMPSIGRFIKRMTGLTVKPTVQPEEAVALGAAVQAGVLSGERDKSTSDLLLLDVTPLTLGIETTGGLMGEIIPRNTVIPTSRSKVYTTAEDNQAAVMNKVFEGERKLTKDNRLLGSFELTGIPPMPKGKAQIEVRFGRSDATHAPPHRSPRSSRHR